MLDIQSNKKNLESLAMLKLLSLSKEDYHSGDYKIAKKAFSDIKNRIAKFQK